jgi:transcriptional regulator with PAS, ATPase and Fis domain
VIVRAAGGTLFLDEIGDLSLASQVKLLRLLQEGEFYPLGSDVPLTSRARLVVATNCGLEGMIASGSFRRDLYYRLSTSKVHIPPLRQRKSDIPLLVETFLEEAAASLQKKKPAYPSELISYLSSYHFPGNVRELRALIFNAVTRHQGGILSLSTFKEATGNDFKPATELDDPCCSDEFLNLSGRFPTLKETEQCLIAAAMKRAAGSQRAAAGLLGISRQALNQRLSKK